MWDRGQPCMVIHDGRSPEKENMLPGSTTGCRFGILELTVVLCSPILQLSLLLWT